MVTSIPSLVFAALLTPTQTAAPESQAIEQALARPVFLENLGQWDERARFRRFAAGVTGWLVDDGWCLVLRGEGAPSVSSQDGHGAPAVALHMQFEGAQDVRPVGQTQAPGKYNWFRGPDPEQWVLGARASECVVWPELYSGITVVARAPRKAGAGVFEYDLELAPGANLGEVRIGLEGHTGLRVDDAGNLVVETAVGELVQPPPVAWQWAGDVRAPLECRFRVIDAQRFGFEAPERDPGLAAVVDPALLFSTYLSGQASQTVEDIEAGPGDSVYVAGWTLSDDFPVSSGSFQEFQAGLEDGFVTRLAGDGKQLVWSSYLGGSDTEVLTGLAVDALGNATVCGQTRSTDYPTQPGSYDTTANGFLDGFVARIAPSGDTLLWSTYLGGGLNDFASDVDLDASGAATVVGGTNGSGFPAFGGFDSSFNGGVFGGDAFVARIANSGSSLVFSSFLGGSKDDNASTVSVESTGEISIAGLTTGSFPVSTFAYDKSYSGPVDTFVARVSSNGKSLVYATYFGNVFETTVSAIALDGSGEAVLLGRTEDPGFPKTPGAFRTAFDGEAEGFYTRLATNGGSLVASTYIGGNGDDEVIGLEVDGTGRLLLAGNTTSDDLPTTPGSYAPVFHDNLGGVFADAFLLRFDSSLSAVDYGTYFGTSSTDTISGFALDASGAALFGGSTNSFQFPTTPDALQETFNLTATSEGFASRLNFLLHPITYGSQPIPGAASISWDGFPSVSDDFSIAVQNATSKKQAILFHGFAPQASPFYGRTIFVQPPLFRHRPVLPDVFGYKSIQVDISPSWVGQTVYFQWWYRDPNNPNKKTGMSDALSVLAHP